MLLHDVQVIGIGVEGSDPQLFALGTIITMIVIGADDCDIINAQNLGNPLGQGGFASGAIPNNA
jgi:hypothetical protein